MLLPQHTLEEVGALAICRFGGTHTPPCFFVPSFPLGFTLPVPSLQSFVLASGLACSQAQRDVHMQAGNSAIRPRYGKATGMKG